MRESGHFINPNYRNSKIEEKIGSTTSPPADTLREVLEDLEM